MPSRQLIILGGVVFLIVIVSVVFLVGRRPGTNAARVELTMWGTESADAMEKLTRGYSAAHTNVRIAYEELSDSEYSAKLLNALAAGKGPDIFMVKSGELPAELLEAPPQTQFALTEMQDLFPKVVEQDFAPDGKIYALPLHVDTLALFYNKTIFDRVGLVNPPVTWAEFEDIVSDLTVVDDQGRVKKSGAAIGGSTRSIHNAPDIFELLMLQNGARMLNSETGSAAFASDKGISALEFYAKFSDAGGTFYTWDDAAKKSSESFAAGETIMIIDYGSSLTSLKNKNPFLEFGVAAVPQVSLDTPISFANYDGLAVSRQSAKKTAAWDFIIESATNPEILQTYLDASGRSPALRSKIATAVRDPKLAVFARQALIARSSYPRDRRDIHNIFNQVILKVITGGADSKTALEQAERQVSDILNARQ